MDTPACQRSGMRVWWRGTATAAGSTECGSGPGKHPCRPIANPHPHLQSRSAASPRRQQGIENHPESPHLAERLPHGMHPRHRPAARSRPAAAAAAARPSCRPAGRPPQRWCRSCSGCQRSWARGGAGPTTAGPQAPARLGQRRSELGGQSAAAGCRRRMGAVPAVLAVPAVPAAAGQAEAAAPPAGKHAAAGEGGRGWGVQTQALLLAPPSHAAAGQPGARGAGAPATAAAPRLGACAARSATAACVEACHERYRGRRLAGNATAAQARHAGRRAVGRVEGRRRHRPHPAATCCLRGCRPWHCLSPGPLRLLGGPGAGPGTCIAAVAYPCNCGRGARQVTHSLRRIASKSDTCCAAASPHLSSPAMYWPCASSCICSPRCACTGRQARHRLGCRE